MQALSIKVVGLALSGLFAVSYALCVLFDLIIPGWAMSPAWRALFPGFSWSVGGLFIGLVETVIYGFFVAVVFVLIYNAVQRREDATSPHH